MKMKYKFNYELTLNYTSENEAHRDMEQNCFLFFPEYIQKNTISLSMVYT